MKDQNDLFTQDLFDYLDTSLIDVSYISYASLFDFIGKAVQETDLQKVPLSFLAGSSKFTYSGKSAPVAHPSRVLGGAAL